MPLVNAKSLLTALLLSLLLPASALAMSNATTRSVNLRAGPDRSFRVVRVLSPRTQVWVNHCTSGWRWCNVRARNDRGWLDARYLQHSVRNRVPINNPRGPRGPGRGPAGPWGPPSG